MSENGILTASDRSTTCVPKSSRGFLELSVRNGENYYKRAAQLLIALLWVAYSLKTLCEVVRDAEKLLYVKFQKERLLDQKFFWHNDVNILTPTTFFHSEPGYLIFCTATVPKLDSIVGEEARLRLLLAKRNSP